MASYEKEPLLKTGARKTPYKSPRTLVENEKGLKTGRPSGILRTYVNAKGPKTAIAKAKIKTEVCQTQSKDWFEK